MAHWGLVLVAAFLLLGRGKFSSVMAHLGEGLRRFRGGLVEEDPLLPHVADAPDSVVPPLVESNAPLVHNVGTHAAEPVSAQIS